MTDIFDFSAPPPLYAVMGNPVAHSKSPQIHKMFSEQCDVRLQYDRIQVDVGGFEQAVQYFQSNGGRGLNITVPFKVEAWRLADELSARARRTEAVNTIQFEHDMIIGDNTDGVGLVTDLKKNLHCSLTGKKILILGAGGAVRGVLQPVLEKAPANLTVANRTVDKAVALAGQFNDLGEIIACGFDKLHGQTFDLVVNGTAASLADELPPLPDQLFNENALAYDMMYADKPTVFMRWANEHGAARTADGIGMLVEQAAESFFIWHGVRPETTPVIEFFMRDNRPHA